MKVGIFTPGERDPHHDKVLTAFAEGVRETGDECFMRPVQEYADCDVAVVFGVRKKAVPFSHHRGEIIDRHKKKNKPVIVIDSGYVKRNDYFMVGLNGLNGRADFKNGSRPSDRWEALEIELKPYRKDGDHILVCGQIPWDASVQDFDHAQWCLDVMEDLRARTKRPIRFRPHPIIATYPLPPLERDMQDAFAVVTFSSNSAVDAVIEGVPVFALDRGSMAWHVANTSLQWIDMPRKAPREAWACNLAYAQWNLEEMREGKPWRHLCH